MFKVVNNIVPAIVSEFFTFSNVNYNLRSGISFINHLRISMEWAGNHFILRTRSLEYSARGNETNIFFIYFQKTN